MTKENHAAFNIISYYTWSPISSHMCSLCKSLETKGREQKNINFQEQIPLVKDRNRLQIMFPGVSMTNHYATVNG